MSNYSANRKAADKLLDLLALESRIDLKDTQEQIYDVKSQYLIVELRLEQANLKPYLVTSHEINNL